MLFRLRPSRRGKRRAATGGANPPDEPFNTNFDLVPGDALLSQTSFQVSNEDQALGGNADSLSECAVAGDGDDYISDRNVPAPDSRKRGTFSSYPGDCGFMSILGGEPQSASQPRQGSIWQVDYGPEHLIEGHLEVFFEYAYTWCPVLDRDAIESVPDIRQSLLLRHALAACANQIRPSLLHHSAPREHYDRVKELFYGNHEPNPLIRVMALMLLYWWSPDPPNVVNIDNTAWWNGVAIQLVQQLGLHRDARVGGPRLVPDSAGLRRRIWWTLVVSKLLSETIHPANQMNSV